MPRAGGSKSANKIAQLLGAEGFSDHTASEVKRYWLKRSGLSKRQQRHIGERKKALSEIMSRLSEADRLIVGKYIGLLQKMSFDAGLRIGLMTLVTELGKQLNDEE